MSVQDDYDALIAHENRRNINAEARVRDSKPDYEPESEEVRAIRNTRAVLLRLALATIPEMPRVQEVVQEFYDNLNRFTDVTQFLPNVDANGVAHEKTFTVPGVRKLTPRRLELMCIVLTLHSIERGGIEFHFQWSPADKAFIPFQVGPH